MYCLLSEWYGLNQLLGSWSRFIVVVVVVIVVVVVVVIVIVVVIVSKGGETI